jgi:malate dehydrogenase (oxaloacetate-decarboxylating)
MGVKDVILCDTKGIIHEGRSVGMNKFKEEMARITNKDQKQGTLADSVVGTNVFVGVSAPGVLTKGMIQTMNPIPEIMPEDAKEAGALVVGTGRSETSKMCGFLLYVKTNFRSSILFIKLYSKPNFNYGKSL